MSSLIESKTEPIRAGGEETNIFLLLKNIGFMIVSNMGAVILSFGISWLMARQLGDRIYGQYVFVLGITNLVIAFADIGLQKVITRELAKHREVAGTWFWTIFLLRVVVFTLAGLAAVMMIPFVDNLQGLEVVTLMVTLSVVAMGIADTIRGVFVAFEKTQFDLITRLIDRGLSLLLVLAAFILGLGLLPITALLAIGSAIGLLVTLVFVFRLIPRSTLGFNTQTAKTALRIGFPMGVSVLIVSFYARYDVLLLGILRTPEEVAWFSIAYTLVLILISFSFSAANAMFPVFSRLSQKSDKTPQLNLIRNAVRYMLVISILAAIGLFFTSRTVVGGIYGAEYMPAADALRILSIALVFLFPTHFMLILLLSENHQRMIVVGHIIAAVTLCIVDPLLISAIGIYGAAWTNVMVECIIFCYYIILIRRYIGPLGLETIARPMLAGAGVVLVYLLLLTEVPDLINMVLLGALFTGAIIATRTVTLADLVQIRKMVQR